MGKPVAKPERFSVAIMSRSIIGKREKIYDAHVYYHGEKFTCTKDSRKDASAGVLLDVNYARESLAVVGANGVCLFACGFENWYFRFIHGGGMCFGAKDLAAALARIAEDYKDHEVAQAFLTDHTLVNGDEFYKTKTERFVALLRAKPEPIGEAQGGHPHIG